jgi:hypothetical protein
MEYEVPLPATGKTPPNYSYRHCNGHAVLHSRWLSGAKTSRCSPKAGKDGNSSRGGRRHSASSAPAGVTLFLSSVSIIVALQPINSGSRRSLGAARAWRGTRWALCLVLLLHAARWWWRKQEHADGMWTLSPSQAETRVYRPTSHGRGRAMARAPTCRVPPPDCHDCVCTCTGPCHDALQSAYQRCCRARSATSTAFYVQHKIHNVYL